MMQVKKLVPVVQELDNAVLVAVSGWLEAEIVKDLAGGL